MSVVQDIQAAVRGCFYNNNGLYSEKNPPSTICHKFNCDSEPNLFVYVVAKVVFSNGQQYDLTFTQATSAQQQKGFTVSVVRDFHTCKLNEASDLSIAIEKQFRVELKSAFEAKKKEDVYANNLSRFNNYFPQDRHSNSQMVTVSFSDSLLRLFDGSSEPASQSHQAKQNEQVETESECAIQIVQAIHKEDQQTTCCGCLPLAQLRSKASHMLFRHRH